MNTRFQEKWPIDLRSLDRDLYNVYKVVVLKRRMVLFKRKRRKNFPLTKETFGNTFRWSNFKFDVCFNIIHGAPGEMSELQGYWNAIGQKYTDCDFYKKRSYFQQKRYSCRFSKIRNSFCKKVLPEKGEKY